MWERILRNFSFIFSHRSTQPFVRDNSKKFYFHIFSQFDTVFYERQLQEVFVSYFITVRHSLLWETVVRNFSHIFSHSSTQLFVRDNCKKFQFHIFSQFDIAFYERQLQEILVSYFIIVRHSLLWKTVVRNFSFIFYHSSTQPFVKDSFKKISFHIFSQFDIAFCERNLIF